MSSDKPEGMGDSFAALFEGQGPSATPPRRRRALRLWRSARGRRRPGRTRRRFRRARRKAAGVHRGRASSATTTARSPSRSATRSRAHVVEVDDEHGVVRLGRSIGKPGSVAALEQAKAAGVARRRQGHRRQQGRPRGRARRRRARSARCRRSTRAFVEDAKTLDRPDAPVPRHRRPRRRQERRPLAPRAPRARSAASRRRRAMSDIVPGAVLRGTVTERSRLRRVRRSRRRRGAHPALRDLRTIAASPSPTRSSRATSSRCRSAR